jgi:saccharopine dehydrogenase-like NADP-dependent oxidoreductase
VARARGGEKATSRAVDARDENGLARLLDAVDVLVNTASYRINLNAMRACLAAGCAYLDLGSTRSIPSCARSLTASAAAAVRLFARGSLDAVGALPPEQCIDPGEMFAELERRGCAFSVTGPA